MPRKVQKYPRNGLNQKESIEAALGRWIQDPIANSRKDYLGRLIYNDFWVFYEDQYP